MQRLVEQSSISSTSSTVQTEEKLSLVEQVIQEAKKTFINGYSINKKLSEEIASGGRLKKQLRFLPYGKDKFIQYDDNYFWNANKIEGTNFIAAAGPKTSCDMFYFIGTLGSARQIVALGSKLSEDDIAGKDFYDYCVRERGEENYSGYKVTVKNKSGKASFLEGCDVFLMSTPKNENYKESNLRHLYLYKRTNGEIFYKIENKEISLADELTDYIKSTLAFNQPEENPVKNDSYFVNLAILNITSKRGHTLPGNKQCLPIEVVQSHLQISHHENQKSLDVTLFALEDNAPLCLQENNEYKEVMWQLYQKSLRGTIVVHCAAGVGRTGHFILTLEILKHYEKLFSTKDPIKIAAGIHQIVNRIRSNRPALVATDAQFEEAIRNADILYRYGLEKKCDAEKLASFAKSQLNSVKKVENEVATEKPKVNQQAYQSSGFFASAAALLRRLCYSNSTVEETKTIKKNNA